MEEILTKYLTNCQPLTADEYARSKADAFNNRIGNLGFINCPLCKNKGVIAAVEDGEVIYKDCKCVIKRSVMRHMKQSGLSDVISRYTFDTFITAEPWQKAMKVAAERYTENETGWFVVTGCPGSGKTHICTAVCGKLLKGNQRVKYFLWRTESPMLKAWANKQEYAEAVEPYKTVPVLYIDDFWKGKVTDADINLAFDILNARYNNTALRTIISSEMTIEQMIQVDEAIGSRIFERSKGSYVRVTGDGKNYRLN